MKTVFLGFNIANSSVSDFFLELANQLSPEYNIVILSNKFQNDKFDISPQVTIFYWPSAKLSSYRSFKFLFEKILKHKPYLMVSVFGAVNPFLILGFCLGVKNRIAWCRSISKQFEVKNWVLKRKKIIYELATLVFANSIATKQDLVENYGVNERKIEVFYNAVRTSEAAKNKTQKNKIVYVGRMSPSKGVDTLLKAMPLILTRFPDLKLQLIGGRIEGKEIVYYKKECKRMKISRSVSFAGNKSKEIVLKEFSTAYLTVVPTIVEAFGFVVIESFSVKTPVVGSNTSGIAEIIRDGRDGFLFETQNHTDLAKKIIYLLENEKIRETFSQNCYQRFTHEFELNKAVSRLKKKMIQMDI